MSVKIVAHRGESFAAPENTLESFTLAWARGATCIEGDFHLSKDGEIICMHDDNLKRTCGADLAISSLTLRELKEYDAGIWKGEAWRFTRIPTLREVLESMPAYGEIYIELKSVGPIVEALKTLFRSGPWRPEQLTFIAFDEATIAEAKKQFPNHNAYWLCGSAIGNTPETRRAERSPEELVAKLKELGVDGVDICESEFLSSAYADALHAEKFGFHVWTVDDPAVAKHLVEIGVDSITTNRAKFIATELGVI